MRVCLNKDVPNCFDSNNQLLATCKIRVTITPDTEEIWSSNGARRLSLSDVKVLSGAPVLISKVCFTRSIGHRKPLFSKWVEVT